MSKRKIYKTNPVRKYLLLSLFLLFFIGIGFSILGTSLSVGGSVNVEEYDNTLYGVIKNATKDGLAVKYTGTHQDSIDASKSTKDIYYFRGTTNTNANKIMNSFNVLFYGHCWEMLRTTDTGGVKLIYNGKAVNGKCLADRPDHVGPGGTDKSYDLSPNYYYGDKYIATYDDLTSSYIYYLDGNVFNSVWNDETYNNLIGKYTCRSTENDSCTDMYYVYDYVDSTHGRVQVFDTDIPASSIGSIGFNREHVSLSDVGYKSNKIYPLEDHSLADSISVLGTSISRMSSTEYYYSDSIRYNSDTGMYELYNQDNSAVSTYLFSSSYTDLPKHYTCNSTSTTCASAYYVVSTTSTSFYHLKLSNGDLLNDVDSSIVTGSDFSGNTLLNTSTIKLSDWNSDRTNLVGRFICSNFTSSECDDVIYIGSTNASKASGWSKSVAGYYKYSNNYIYQNGQYKLTGDTLQSLNYGDRNTVDFSSYYYSCLSESDTCDKLYKVEYSTKTTQGKTEFTKRYYIELNNGESYQDAINNMLYANDVNQIDSIMKLSIDGWFRTFKKTETLNYLDDVIYCNDRSTTTDLSTINSVSRMRIDFDNSTSGVDFSCKNITDRFSVSNPLAKLDYPIGLPTSEELNAWGSNSLRATNYSYYTGSPRDFNIYSTMLIVGSEGAYNVSANISADEHVRPVIAIKAGYPIIDGDGSHEHPYIITSSDSEN